MTGPIFGTSESCTDPASDPIVGEFFQSTGDGIHSPQISMLAKDMKDTEDTVCASGRRPSRSGEGRGKRFLVFLRQNTEPVPEGV